MNYLFAKYKAKCRKCYIIQEFFNNKQKQCNICKKLEIDLIYQLFIDLYEINITKNNKKFIKLKKSKSISNLSNYN